VCRDPGGRLGQRSFLSHVFFVWFDLFIIKGKEGSLKGTADLAPDSENRLVKQIYQF
jgi:hypothetical protein